MAKKQTQTEREKKSLEELHRNLSSKLMSVPIEKWNITSCTRESSSELHYGKSKYNDLWGQYDEDDWHTYNHNLDISAWTTFERNCSIKISAKNYEKDTSEKDPYTHAQLSLLVNGCNMGDKHKSDISLLCSRIYRHQDDLKTKKLEKEARKIKIQEEQERKDRTKREKSVLESIL